MTNTPSHGATSLRKHPIEDMNVHRLSQATQRNYMRDAARFAGWAGRMIPSPPDGFSQNKSALALRRISSRGEP